MTAPKPTDPAPVQPWPAWRIAAFSFLVLLAVVFFLVGMRTGLQMNSDNRWLAAVLVGTFYAIFPGGLAALLLVRRIV